MQKEQRVNKIDATIEEIDDETVAIGFDEEEEYYDIQSMRRVNYLETKTARGLEAKNRALLTEIQEAMATMQLIKEAEEILKEVELLFSINHDSKRTREIISNKIYSLLTRAKRLILTDDYKNKRITLSKVRNEVIGHPYIAPHSSSYDLEKEYLRKTEPEEKGFK